ncbi:MAG: hypothetical protein RLZZ165_358 [Bacteroidota bacterium]|jgi:hypothetical protein
MRRTVAVLFLLMGLVSCHQQMPTDAGAHHGEMVAADSIEASEGEAGKAEAALPDPDAVGNFGDPVTAEGAIPSTDLLEKLNGRDSIRVKVKGSISSCCQAKGCWLKMPLASGQEMTVKFKDYGFFVPKNSAGKPVVIDGWVYQETVSVEELRHIAEDAGKSEAEITKITRPEAQVAFTADGILIEASGDRAD